MNYGLVFQAVFLMELSSAVFGLDARLDGKPLNSGGSALKDTSEGTAGMVFGTSDTGLHLKAFSFGTGSSVPPDVQFILGSKTYDKTVTLTSSDYKVVPDETGSNTPLKKYENKDLFISRSSGDSIANFKYFALYSTSNNTYYGAVEIAAGWTAPAAIVVGKFPGTTHLVKSDDVTIIDTKRIYIRKFSYDGQGPDAYFYVGNTTAVVTQTAPMGVIPDENGNSARKAQAYSDKNIVLTLPDGITVYDIKWLSMYCLQAVADFGHVNISANIGADKYVPVMVEFEINEEEMNCEELSDNMQVRWQMADDGIMFKLDGKITQNYYMAFGLSGMDDRHWMIGADVVVGSYSEEGDVNIADYKLTDRSQCANGNGVCPDTQLSTPGYYNVRSTFGTRVDGVTSLYYTRPPQTSDQGDKVYKLDGTAQQIVWGIGPLNTKGTAAIHTEVIRESKTINFARTSQDNCESFSMGGTVVQKPDFKKYHLYGDDTDTFTAEIGQSGSEQGYMAITGNPSWGIAWYIDEILVPELHLVIGKEYTFRVAGGKDSTQGAKYHPFYITDDQFGGYGTLKNQTVKNMQTIYPGMIDGSTAQYAVGDFCEWSATAEFIRLATEGRVWKCFDDYKNHLMLKCEDGTKYTEFKWTPTTDHPTTVYYQCYTHQNLGWKINLYSKANFPTTKIKTESCLGGTADVKSFAAIFLVLPSLLHLFI